MSKIGLFIANGCEEIEALTVVDILRRATIEVDMISITGEMDATGSHGIRFFCDKKIEDADIGAYDGLVLPGGMPGTTNLGANEAVVESIKEFSAKGKLVAAICAAPTVLGDNGVLEGKKAVCYPGLEDRLKGAEVEAKPAVSDQNIITGRGMGAAIPFALEIVSYLKDAAAAEEIRKGIVFE